ncbi:YidC/Oxa1 family membrane protein insertase [Patescibacteria group bacterium]|nr:YidC/Oxa1 family membrane protein insertase [Patescibacteria group bacterium]MBU1063014.1 YidC/Oxa1 family membrane protein insertase [Patescibacteria group bacterium]MBU1783060.1 YidC/Oxa1 family membrane protein insertase [Patescibacteria group bacterium]MBU1991814.1 YidC/Oxa1 family membrane protein insertase [Patescibacteria group bacterium]MBU2081115.1 YidC/Oxa1 family membrane protein insertase [Patescibacteria group bacterium]
MYNFFHVVFYQPILNLLIFLYNVIPGHDIGLAIIALTILIKLAFLPLSKKAIESQKSLQDIQPKIEALKKEYANDKEKMGKEMMNLYKEEKVNPFSSCLPLLIQLPFLWAVFEVFRDGLSGKGLDLVYGFIYRPEVINYVSFGVINLAKPNVVLAILAGLAQFWQAKMMITTRPAVKGEGSKDEDMAAIMNKQMLYFMPALTVFFCLSFPGGLALYWLITTVLAILQQAYLFKQKTTIKSEVVVIDK